MSQETEEVTSEETEEVTIAEKAQEWVDSEVGQNIITLAAFGVKQSETTTDDEIVENAAAIAEVLTNALQKVSEESPTKKEAKKAGVETLKWVADQTSTPLDDIAVGALSIFY